MIKFLDKFLYKHFPKLHSYSKKEFNNIKKKIHPKITKSQFIELLTNDLGIKQGDVLFIHSSMRKLYLDFSKDEILSILKDTVGPSGTLLFPCWHFSSRAEEYIEQNDIVFSINNSPSAMGKISDSLRKVPESFRSFHPTNSIIGIGKNAEELLKGHEDGIYPCGEQSPFYKMMKFNAKIIGIGVTVDNLTFVHAVEDVMREEFPKKTRLDQIYECKCLDRENSIKVVRTLVASRQISNRNVTAFFNREIPQNICKRIRKKGMDFFAGNSPELFDTIRKSALNNKTIYLN